MSSQILVIGSLNMDFIIKVPHIPIGGETLLGTGFARAPGGKGANQAVAASRLSAIVKMVGRVGDDEFGAFLRKTLEDAGVDASEVKSESNNTTGLAFILLDAAGQNSIAVIQGANLILSKKDVKALSPLFEESRILLLQLEIATDAIKEAINQAKKSGLQVVLDAGPPTRLEPELLKQIDVLSPNETELGAILGREIHSFEEDLEAVDQLLEIGVKSVALKLGAQGCLIATPEGKEKIPAFRVNPVDTTGAGDAFTAALCVALSEGKALREAAIFSNAAGALATTRLGAQPSMPTRSEVDALLASSI